MMEAQEILDRYVEILSKRIEELKASAARSEAKGRIESAEKFLKKADSYKALIEEIESKRDSLNPENVVKFGGYYAYTENQGLDIRAQAEDVETGWMDILAVEE